MSLSRVLVRAEARLSLLTTRHAARVTWGVGSRAQVTGKREGSTFSAHQVPVASGTASNHAHRGVALSALIWQYDPVLLLFTSTQDKLIRVNCYKTKWDMVSGLDVFSRHSFELTGGFGHLEVGRLSLCRPELVIVLHRTAMASNGYTDICMCYCRPYNFMHKFLCRDNLCKHRVHVAKYIPE